MDQLVENKGIVKEKIKGAIDIGCTMVYRSKKVRKKLNSETEDKSSLKKSIKELDRMTMELIDKLFEINARIDQPERRKSRIGMLYQKFVRSAHSFARGFRSMINRMRLTYQDVFTL